MLEGHLWILEYSSDLAGDLVMVVTFLWVIIKYICYPVSPTWNIRNSFGLASPMQHVTFLCMTQKCDLLGNCLLEIISNRHVRIHSQIICIIVVLKVLKLFHSHTEKSNIQIRNAKRLNNYPLLLQIGKTLKQITAWLYYVF